MVWPFGSKGKISGELDARKELERSLPSDLRDFLKTQDDSAISDREFKERLKLEDPHVQNYQQPITPEQVMKSDKQEEASEPSVAASQYVPMVYQPTEHLSQEELKKMREFEEYNRKYPIHYASVENCADLQADFLNCLSSGSFVDKFTVCNVKNNFYQDCIKFQGEAMYMFDYPAVGTLEEKVEIRRRADTLFHKYYSCYEDLANDDKRQQYAKELRSSREEFYDKFRRW
ncbi:unnamed protein product [Kuraishia capsulata CBS 1993]|uniref:Uncharacterized protein n=1 Tax=Kuraishia capsulata CBS 1993 TaxID=1382522 RepID=W6MGL6_9ASCO|nr:uncharacterized protein KUCA_T00000938001 [Kuraishia capsulata CBS 1993]CDK24971.1 unnamed protein product [Kuraishia capsulata CBS 1993]